MTKTDIQVIVNYTLGWVRTAIKMGEPIENQSAKEITASFLKSNTYIREQLTDKEAKK